MADDPGADMAEAAAVAAAPAAAVVSGPDSVPVGDAGDHLTASPAFALPAEPAPAAAGEARAKTSVEVPTHEVTGPPPNPKRGWWRRMIDS